MKPIDELSDAELTKLARRALEEPDSPTALLRAAIALWPASAASPLRDAARAVVERVAAVLIFDNWGPQTAASDVRAASSEVRHLLFSAMGRDVDVRIIPSADHYALAGQILGPDGSGVVELVDHSATGAEAAPSRIATLDALGEFRLDGVPRGTYVLTLRLGDEEIVLPRIDVGGERRP